MSNPPLRSLFITVDPPYPATSGAPLRNWQNISLARALGSVAVLSVGYDPARTLALPGVASYEHLTLTRDRVTTVRGFPALTGAAAEAIVTAAVRMAGIFRPDVCIVENVWIADLVPFLRAWGPVILDLHNAYAAVGTEMRFDVPAIRLLEGNAIAEADRLWLCSADDAHRIRSTYPAAPPISIIPNGVDIAAYASVRARPVGRSTNTLTIAYIGSYWYEPNRIAAEYLIDDVLPAVRARTDADVRLFLVGAGPSPAMCAAATRRGITVTGRVADVRRYLRLADAVVVPLRHGGGTRLKILEAFAALRPVVATTKAVEGIDARDGITYLDAETAPAIATAVVSLQRDRASAERIARAAFALVCERYSWGAIASAVADALMEASLSARNGPIRR